MKMLEQFKKYQKKFKDTEEEVFEAYNHLTIKIYTEKNIEKQNELKNITGVLAAQIMYLREINDFENFKSNDLELIDNTLKSINTTCNHIMSL